jgi:hypothetical protein
MGTDWRKYRKSTHLASADLDAMETDGLPLIFTIKEVKYETGVDVSGTKQDGIFCYFMEAVKPLKLNSTNNKILAGFAKQDGLIGKECHVIENWSGMKIELFVDRNVKMMGAITDGIRVKAIRPKEKVKKEFTQANFEGALKVKATREQIEKNYTITEEIWKMYNAQMNGTNNVEVNLPPAK